MIETVIATKQHELELRKKARHLTFKHFMDNPPWAAAAGYEFNILDCLSAATKEIEPRGGINAILRIGYLEIREAYWIPFNLSCALLAFSWPLVFWIYGIGLWFKCRRYKKKYLNSTNRMVQKNLERWIDVTDMNIKRGIIK